MNEKEIIETFKIDHSGAIALTEQLRRQLDKFIKNSGGGAKIPPERNLASTLNVSRVTVRNALQGFYENGDIVRNGRRGTFVAKNKFSQAASDIHPMALGMSESIVKAMPSTLVLSLHENIPYQKKFWEMAVARFNATNSTATVEISWLPKHINMENILEYYNENPVDIIQVQLMREMLPLGQTIPASFKQELLAEDFWISQYPEETRQLLDKIIPIHHTAHFTFWNQTLADKIGMKNIRQRLCEGRILELLAEATEKLPQEYLAAGHIWDWAAFQGIPADVNLHSMTEYNRSLFAQLTPYVGNKRMFMTDQAHSFDSIELFAAGRQLFLNNIPTHLFLFGETLDFELGIMPFKLKPENIIASSAMGFCVSPSCTKPDKALEFISFILSAEMQDSVAKMKMVTPVLVSSLRALGERTDIDLDLLYAAADQEVICPDLQAFLNVCYRSMIVSSRKELRSIMQGGAPAAVAADSYTAKLLNELKLNNINLE